MVMNTQR